MSILENCGVPNNRIYAATMENAGDNVSIAHYDVDFTRSGGGAAVVLGAEGEGLRQELRSAVKRGKISAIHVPMAPGTESLNAGVAGSVIMFERMRQLSSIMRNVKDR
jgi:TrmH family RNA methyltransferase